MPAFLFVAFVFLLFLTKLMHPYCCLVTKHTCKTENLLDYHVSLLASIIITLATGKM